MVLALDLAPVQLPRKGGDVRFCSVTPWRKEVVFDGQLILGDNNKPRADLGDHFFYRLFFLPYVVLLKFLGVLLVDGRDDSFDRHRVDHLLEGVLLTLDLLVLLELDDFAPLGTVRNSWVDYIGLI